MAHIYNDFAEQVLISSKMLCASLEGSVDFVDDEFDNLENFIF